MRDKKKIRISVLNQGHIRTELVKTLLYYDRDNRFVTELEFAADKPIANNRNKIVDRFLNESDADYLVMIDSDIVPPANFLELADYNVDIITPLMFAYRSIGIVPLALEEVEKVDEITEEQAYTNKTLGTATPLVDKAKKVSYNVIGTREGKNYFDEGLLKVDATGTGAIIIRREVLENMNAPFIDEFDEEVGERILGLDLNFCYRASKIGFDSYVHTDYQASHFTDIDQKDVYKMLAGDKIKIQAVGNRKVA